MIDILDIRTIGKKIDSSISLINTRYGNETEPTISNETNMKDDNAIIPVLIHKINELTDRINDFHGINE